MKPLDILDCIHIELKLRELENGNTEDAVILSGQGKILIDVKDKIASPICCIDKRWKLTRSKEGVRERGS